MPETPSHDAGPGRAARSVVGATGLVLLVVVTSGAVALTLARAFQPPWGPSVQLVAFAPLAVAAYGLSLLLALVLLARRRRAALGFVAALAAAGLALHGWWFSPQVFGETPEADPDAPRATVMAANLLRGEADAESVVRLVREEGVEVLVASEITTTALADLDAAGLAELLPHRAGEATEPGTVEGTVVLAAEPVELLEEVDTFQDSLLVETGGVTLLAVHPAPPTLPGAWRADHDLLRDVVEEREPDVVLGDFNATEDHAPLLALGDLGYRGAAELLNRGWAPTWPEGGEFGLIGALGAIARIDHVLLGDGWTATGSDDEAVEGTDHRVVWAEVAPRRGDR